MVTPELPEYMIERKPTRNERFNEWIIDVLLVNGKTRFNELLIKTQQLRRSQFKGYNGYMPTISRKTLSLHLLELVKNGIVRKTRLSHKLVLYELADRESTESWFYTRLLENIDHALTTLKYSSKKPFFDLLEILPNMKREDWERLRDFTKTITDLIDRYLTAQPHSLASEANPA